MTEVLFLNILLSITAILMFRHEHQLDRMNLILSHDWKAHHFHLGFFIPLFCCWLCLPWSLSNPALGALPCLIIGPFLFWKLRKFWNLSIPEPIEETKAIHRRLVQLQHQLQKLQEREMLGLKLEKSTHNLMVLRRYEDRFNLILMAIENHLIFGDHEKAERIITLFARHLRHLLHESSLPFIPTREVLGHAQTYLQLMNLLSAGKFQCEIDDGMLDEATKERFTEPLKLSPWIEEQIFPYFTWAERSNQPLAPMCLLLDLEDDGLLVQYHLMEEGASKKLEEQKFKLLGSSEPEHAPTEARIVQVA